MRAPDRPIGEDLVLPDGVHLQDADFSGRRFEYLSIGEGSRLIHCDFRGSRITDGGLGGGKRPTLYQDCLFDRTYLRGVIPGRTRFVSCSFRDATLIDFRCHDAEFVDCVFSGMLKTSWFNGRVREPDPYLGRERNEFRGNDFRAADLRGVAFRTGIDLDLQFLPEGPDYLLLRDAAGVLERTRQAVLEWPDDRLRGRALIVLDVYEEDVRDGQDGLFIRASCLSSVPEVADRLAQTIRRVLARNGQ